MIAVGPLVAALMTLSHLTEPHAREIATPIAAVASTMEEGILLADTVDAEGGVRRKVMDCRILGDHGHAFGGWQLHRWHIRGSVANFCRDTKLQAELALRALGHGDTIQERIAAFMGRKTSDREVVRRVRRYERLMKQIREMQENQANG